VSFDLVKCPLNADWNRVEDTIIELLNAMTIKLEERLKQLVEWGAAESVFAENGHSGNRMLS
jgi:hypothetical protein